MAIARALATDPDVLLADEPVSMLDVSIRLEILNLLDRLKRDRNLAMLYVTHDLATARHFSAEIMVMYRGEIVEHGPSDEVILSPAHPYTQILAGAAPDPTALPGRPGGRPARSQAVRPGRPGRPNAGGRTRPGLPVPGPLPARDARVRDPSPRGGDCAGAPGPVLAAHARRRERSRRRRRGRERKTGRALLIEEACRSSPCWGTRTRT